MGGGRLFTGRRKHDVGRLRCGFGNMLDWVYAGAGLGTPDGKAAFKLADTNVPIAPIILGHPKSTAAPVPRKTPKIDWIS